MEKTFIAAIGLVVVLTSFNGTQDRKRYAAALPIEGWEVVIRGLGKLPLEEAEQVKASLIQQIEPQLQPPTPVQKQDTTKKKN